LKKIEIESMATHPYFHLDEATAMFQLECFGESRFPGISKAKIEFLTSPPAEMSERTVYVGIGGGMFDEHRQGGRLPNTCAAKLVAQYLDLCNRRGLHQLLDEVLTADTTPKVFPSQLGNLIKTMHRVKYGSNQLGTYRWAREALRAIIFSGTVDVSYDLRKIWETHCKSRDFSLDSVKSMTADVIHQSFGRRKSLTTELASICQLMDPDIRQTWLPVTLDMLLEDSRLFDQAVKLVESKENLVTEVQTPRGPEPMMSIESDNEYIHRVASSTRTGKTAITIVRKSNGHTQIFGNPTLKLNFGALAQMLRMAEYRTWTGKKLEAEKALGEGTIPECQQWHLPNTNMVLNGSLSHPEVKPSALSLEEIKEIASNAFTPALREAWLKQYQTELTAAETLDLII
jgi:hypothetical protein